MGYLLLPIILMVRLMCNRITRIAMNRRLEASSVPHSTPLQHGFCPLSLQHLLRPFPYLKLFPFFTTTLFLKR